MALINCPECNKEVSDKAEICPNCGFGVAKYVKRQKEILKIQEEAEKEAYLYVKQKKREDREIAERKKREEIDRKNSIYNDAVNKFGSESSKDVEKAEVLFSTISGWKDSDSYLSKCKDKIDELIQQEKEQEKKRKRNIRNGIIIATFLFIVIVIPISINTYKLSQEFVVSQEIFSIEAGSKIDYSQIISCDKDAKIVLKEGEIDSLLVGTYNLVYDVSYRGKHQEIMVTVNVNDTTPPELIVETNNVPWMSSSKLINDEYISVVDNSDESPNISVIEGHLDTTKTGDYTIVYELSDKYGNSNTAEVTYHVRDGLYPTFSEHERRLYASIQGNWKADASWTNNNVKMIIHFEGLKYRYKDSNGKEYTGTYSINESIRPTNEDENCLFCIHLSNYRKNPSNLFYYYNSETESEYISDQFVNDQWFENYSNYTWISSGLKSFEKEFKE